MGEKIDSGGSSDDWARAVETTIDGETAAPGPPVADVVFDLLSREHRRFVLYCLLQREEAIDLPTLVENVADLIEESSSSTESTHDRVYARLSHTALPRLADAGVLVHDREAGVVWPTDAVAAMEPLLDLASDLDFETEPASLENDAPE